MAHAQRHTHSGDIEEEQQDSLTLLIWRKYWSWCTWDGL